MGAAGLAAAAGAGRRAGAGLFGAGFFGAGGGASSTASSSSMFKRKSATSSSTAACDRFPLTEGRDRPSSAGAVSSNDGLVFPFGGGLLFPTGGKGSLDMGRPSMKPPAGGKINEIDTNKALAGPAEGTAGLEGRPQTRRIIPNRQNACNGPLDRKREVFLVTGHKIGKRPSPVGPSSPDQSSPKARSLSEKSTKPMLCRVPAAVSMSATCRARAALPWGPIRRG